MARTLAAGKALAGKTHTALPGVFSKRVDDGPKFCSYKITQEIVAEHSL